MSNPETMVRGELMHGETYDMQHNNPLHQQQTAFDVDYPKYSSSMALHTGMHDSIVGDFLHKPGDVAHAVLDHIKRNKSLRQVMSEQAPHLVSALTQAIGASKHKQQELGRIASKVIEHATAGEERSHAVDLSGRYQKQEEPLDYSIASTRQF